MGMNDHDIEFAGQILTNRQNLDDKQVNEWMNNPGHLKLLKEMAAIRQKYNPTDFCMNEEAEYNRLKKRVDLRGERRLRTYWYAAASVIILVGILAGWLWYGRIQQTDDVLLAGGKRLELREHKIELVLADGETVELKGKSRQVNGEFESGILSDSTDGLSYAAAKVEAGGEKKEVYNTLKIPTCGFYRLELSDGTRVWLNSETELRYPVAFTGGERKVYLSGEAYFEVKPDRKHPFIVATKEQMQVKVYGTEFNVNTYNPENIQTTLVSGKVAVELPVSGQQYMLKPDEMAEYSERDKKVVVSQVDTYMHTAWKDGKFVFENETMEVIMERLSRWYDCEVFFSGSRCREHRFTGVITRFSDLADVLYLIGETAEVDFEIKGNTVMVK